MTSTSIFRKSTMTALAVALLAIGGALTQTGIATAQSMDTSEIVAIEFREGSFRYIGKTTWLLTAPQGKRRFVETGRGETTIHLYDAKSNTGVQLLIDSGEIMMSQNNRGWRTVDDMTAIRSVGDR